MNLLFSSSNPFTGGCRRKTVAAGGLLGLLLTSPLAARAQGAEKSAVDKPSGKEYVLAHKSSYSSPTAQRSPFWPIGWVPTAAAPTAEAATAVVIPTVKPEDFVVTSISLDYPPLAVINKHTYGVGERIPVGPAPAAGTAAAKGGDFVTVRQIVDGVVVLDHRGTALRCTTGLSMAAARGR